MVVGAQNRAGNGARRMAGLKTRGPGGSGEGLRSSSLASPTPRVVASAHLLLEAGSTVAVVLLVAEAIPGCRCPISCVLGVDRGLAHASRGRCMMLRGASSPSGGRALGSSDSGVF
jgi:hypothetical protein